jgi:hypothetical protein
LLGAVRRSRGTSSLLADAAWTGFMLRMETFRARESLLDAKAQLDGRPTTGWRRRLGWLRRGAVALLLALLELLWSGLVAALLPLLIGVVYLVVFVIVAVPLYMALGYFLYRMLVVW